MISLDRDEARDLCRQTLAGAPTRQRSLLVEIDARGTHLIAAAGAEPIAIWTLGLEDLEDRRAVVDALGQARLGLLRAWFRRGLVILGLSAGNPWARRRELSLRRALEGLLGDPADAATLHAA
jgi:hypothetical protein